VLKRLQPALLMIASTLLSTSFASAQPAQATREQITLRGTVEAVDQKARTLRIRGDRGNMVTVDIPESISRLDQVKPGDVVSVEYYDRVSVRPKPAGEPPVDKTDPPATTITPGALPGATVASARTATVTITGWDPAARVVTFTDANNTAYSRHLLDSTDAGLMAGIKVGDRVDVTRTEAVRMAVEQRTSVQMTGTSTFQNRTTFGLFWGVDNSFSGNMIKGATGTTTTGIPVAFNETTYDDVYGRIGTFKLAGAYRTTPRTEAYGNFVYAKSDATQHVPVGHAGPANTTLFANFDSYDYWGIEGGQRFFFTRVRLTPFVGYNLGINRYGDIHGHFVDVPLSVTPGLAAQDGKFFESSWAFSVAPTTGLLIGAGPFELMVEAELRYMGGLSDVDWLVEEGLKDINTESARWSFPILFGARIRFK